MSDDIPMVVCRCCNGEGRIYPQFDKAIALLQELYDKDIETIDTAIDFALCQMQVKHRKREHYRRVIKRFCDIVEKFHGQARASILSITPPEEV